MKPERGAGFWSSIGIACLTISLAFGFVRYRFGAPAPKVEAKVPEAIPTDVKQVRVNDPVLPAPPAKYKALKQNPSVLIEWADNGTALWMDGYLSDKRTYTLRTLDGRVTKYDNLKPQDRISISQGGRVFRFSAPYPGAMMGMRRYAGSFGIGYDMLIPSNRAAIAYSRRFTNEGAYIGITNEGKAYTLGEFVEGKMVRKVHTSLNNFAVVERTPDGTWFIYDFGSSKKRVTSLYMSTKQGSQNISLPEESSVRSVAQTRGRTLITLSLKEGKSLRDQLYELNGTKLRPIRTPKPFKSIIIQKITNDGFVIGNAELSPGQHIPIAIRKGKLYDLRRLPQWPNEWVDTYVAGANRRGDIYVGTTSPGPGGEPQFRMLQRLDAQ